MGDTKIVLLYVLFVMMMAYKGCSTSELNVIQSSNGVSSKIYKILGRKEGNVLFCPVSANIPLSLVYLAAKGETAEELKTGLQLSSNFDEIKSGYKNLIQQLNDKQLKLATRLYPRIGLSFNPEFLSTAQNDFDSGVEEINYKQPAKAAQIINSFVEQKTNNSIHDLINPSSIDENTAMIIVNAAHFKDNWAHPFSETKEADFYTNKNQKVKVQMMMETDRFKFTASESLNAKVLQLPFQDENYSMVVVLPNEINGLHDLEAKITSFDEVLKNLSYTQVKVKLPKFKIESTLDLKSVLQEMGIKTIFTQKSDLSGLAQGQPLSVSDIIQKTFIDVNEHGVEAAAATAVGIGLLSSYFPVKPPQEFTVDHPFLFALIQNNLILFQGRVTEI